MSAWQGNARNENLKRGVDIKNRLPRKIIASLCASIISAVVVNSASAQTDATPAVAEEDLGTAKPNSRQKPGTYFSMQLKNPPPMPFNPFPDLPVYEIGDGRFAYDDRSVDYQALRQWRSANAKFGAALLLEPAAPGRSTMLGISTNGGSGGQAMNFGETPEHVELVFGSGGTNSLRMSNLQVGSNYYVIAKQDITPNIDNPWYVLGSFVATASDQTVSIYTPSSIPMEFYTLWRGEYSGPQLAIQSPTNGAIVSGDVIVQMSLMDISAVSLFAYVNGQPLATIPDLVGTDIRSQIGAKHSGSPELIIPEGVLRNGPNNISIVAVNHGVAVASDPTNTLSLGSTVSFSTTRDFTIIASNEFAIAVNPDMSSTNTGTSEFKIEVTRAGDVTLDILALDGDPVKSITTNISNPNGALVTMRWDFRHTDGTPYTNFAYVARYTFVPTATGLAAAAGGGKATWFTNRIDRNPLISGSPLITWMDLPELPTMNSLCDTVFDDLHELFSYIIPTFYYTPAEIGPNRTYPQKLKFVETTMVTNVTQFHRQMTNLVFDTWVYHGHGNQNSLGFNTVGGGPPPAGSDVSAGGVARDLGNAYHPDYTGLVDYKRRLRTVILHGCRTASLSFTTNNPLTPFATEWPNATGTPTGVDQTINRIYKTAFIGFAGPGDVLPTPAFIEALMDDWPHLTLQDPNVPIVESMAFALDFAWVWDNGPEFVQPFGPKLLGFPWLPYTTIWDKQLSTNNFSSIHFFPF